MRFAWPRRAEEVEPYSVLPRIYDFVMRHVNYSRWTEYICQIFALSDRPVYTVLDISCGTASLAIRLAEKGYSVSGFDQSYGMVQQAKARVVRCGRPIPIWQGDMRHFALRHRQDAVVSLYDSVNYLLYPEDWQGLFSSVHRALNDGGLFIFDICTERNSLRNFHHYYERDSGNGFHYRRRSRYLRKEKVQLNEFEISFADEGSKLYREVHRQRIYSLGELTAIIADSPFQVKGMFDGFTTKLASEKAERVHFVLQK